MKNGFLCKKIGMTQLFNEHGMSYAASVLKVMDHKILHIKHETVKVSRKRAHCSQETSSINMKVAVLGIGKKKPNKSVRTELNNNGVDGQGVLKEIKLGNNEKYGDLLKENSIVSYDIFQNDQVVSVSGVTKGKGFQGTVKRWGFSMQPASHGNSKAHRLAGSTNSCQEPGRVFKGKKMAGHMGNDRRTIHGMKIVKVSKEHGVLFLKGSVMGPRNGIVMIK